MSHEPSASTFDQASDSSHSTDHASSLSSPQAAAIGDPDNIEQQVRKAVKVLKTQFLDHLIRQLDIMTYCELSILYYME